MIALPPKADHGCQITVMKAFLLMITMGALAGCGKEPLITDPIIEAAVREQLSKPAGELTITDLQEVRVLHLHDTQITDKGLKEVVKLTHLIELDLLGSKEITDVGLKELAKLQYLETLGLPGQTTDQSLREVVKLTHLMALGLKDCTQITDTGLGELTKLSRLSSLWLPPHITDASLKEITKLKQLKLLILSGTKVTEAGIAGLQKALPNCNIISTPPN